MSTILIKNAQVVNEGEVKAQDLWIKNGRIEKIAGTIDISDDKEINAEGLHLFPGLIDDQVHFREPGLTHRATTYTESRAAVAGGPTSLRETTNPVPNPSTQQ